VRGNSGQLAEEHESRRNANAILEAVDGPIRGQAPLTEEANGPLNKRLDAICTEMFIKPERAKVVAFVPYMQTGQSVLVAKGNPHNVRRFDDICGLHAGLQLGTVQEVTVREQSKACEAQGKPSVDIKTFNYAADAVTQILNGRADFWMADDPEVAFYATKTPDKVEIAVTGINPGLKGIAVRPGDYVLAGAITAALYKMKLDGSYHKVMVMWGIGADELNFF